MSELVKVKFKRGYGIWNPRETAGFEAAKASELVRMGVASYVDQPVKEPKPAPKTKAKDTKPVKDKAVKKAPKKKKLMTRLFGSDESGD